MPTAALKKTEITPKIDGASVKQINCTVLHRSTRLELSDEDKNSRTVEITFSSEEPVGRFFGEEILDHSKKSVMLDWFRSGRAPLLDQHNPDVQIGVIESAEIGGDRKGRALIRFGKNGISDDRFQDVVDGIRTNISVRYRIHEMRLEEETKDGPAIYRVTLWEPLEISLVSIPADQTVGVGRSEGKDAMPVKIFNPNHKENRAMPQATATPEAATPEAPATPTQVDVRAIEQKGAEKERARISGIRAIGERMKLQEKAEEFILSGKSLEDFRVFAIENLPGVTPIRGADANPSIGLSEREAKSFSLIRAIQAGMTGDWSNAGFEKEVSDATRKKFSNKKYEGMFTVPMDVMLAGRQSLAHVAKENQQRDLNTGTGSAGGYLVGTQHEAGSFIELLRSQLILTKLGARVLSGLVGNLAIPKQTAGATAYWVTEGNAVTESAQTLGQVTLSPKTVGGFVDMTRRMLLQSSPDIEDLVRTDLAATLAIAIDTAGLNGGGSGEPVGILQTTGRNTFDYTTGPTFADVVNMEREVEIDNAIMQTMAYVTTPTLKAQMKTTLMASAVPGFIYQNDEINGYPAVSSNLCPAAKLIFGDFSKVIIGEWGTLDFIMDQSVLGTSGGLRIIALQDVDVAVRLAQAFCEGYT